MNMDINYGQFLNMMPEATLVLVLIVLFIADFCLTGSEKKHPVLRALAIGMLVLQIVPCALAEPTSAFGEMYLTSNAANAMKLILTAGTAVVAILAQAWIEKNEITSRYEGEFYMLLVSTLLGMYMMVSSANFLMFFLGLEMASVPMAALVALDKWKKDSAEAAAKYILTATFSSGVMLYGISMLYGATGSLTFHLVGVNIANQWNLLNGQCIMAIMGMVFFFSGLGFKLSLVPFHFWTADTYQGAPTTVTAYLSVISKGAAAFALCAILFKVFAPLAEYWQVLLYVVVVLSITIANLFAIRQSELKRFMAFSSISQAGYIMLAVIGMSYESSLAALMYYTLVYVAANLAVFTVINVVEQNNGGRTDFAAYDGLYQTNPKLSFLMTIALFSLAGIPPFAGMFSKFFVFMAAVNGHDVETSMGAWAYAVVFIALVNTVVSLYYYLLIVKAMYINKTDSPLPAFRSDNSTRLALALCTAGIALFGVCSLFYEWIAGVCG